MQLCGKFVSVELHHKRILIPVVLLHTVERWGRRKGHRIKAACIISQEKF